MANKNKSAQQKAQETASSVIKGTNKNEASTGSGMDFGKKSEQAETQAKKVGGTKGGQFGMDQIWKKIAQHKPKSDDVAGNALKDTFMYDAATKHMDHAQSQAAGWQNAEIQSGLMEQTANLELRNTGMNMDKEFAYGMSKMGAEADIQDQFSQNESIRNLATMSHAGDIQKGQTKAEGQEQRKGIDAQGKQDRKGIKETGLQSRKGMKTQGEIDRLAMKKASGYRTTEQKQQGKQDRLGIEKSGQQSRKGMQTQGERRRRRSRRREDASRGDLGNFPSNSPGDSLVIVNVAMLWICCQLPH